MKRLLFILFPIFSFGQEGYFAIYSGSGQAISSTSYTVIDLGSEDVDAGNIVSESAGVFTPSVAGFYFIEASGRVEVSHNNRANFRWDILKNGAAYSGTSSTGYARNNTNDKAWMQPRAIMYFNGTTDNFSIQHKRDIGAGTVAGTYNFTYLKLVHLGGSLPYANYGTPTAGAFGGSALTATSGWDAVTETDTNIIEIQAGGTAIRLKEANRPYLIVYTAENNTGGGVRTTRISDITISGTRVGMSGGYAYQRDSANEFGSMSGMALVYPTTANQDINLRIAGYENDAATLWGTFDNGSWTLSSVAGQSGISVIALPTTTDIGIYNDVTGGVTYNGSATTDISLFKTVIKEDAPFSRISDTQIDVTSATDVLAYGSTMVERTASSGTRQSNAIRFEVEGVDQSETEGGEYMRGEQGSQDTKNQVVQSTYLDAAALNASFNLEKFDPTTDDGANDQTTWGGAFFIDLSTLGVAAPPASTGQMKYYNGSAWEAKPVKVWNGSAWEIKPLKRWNGSAWVITPY